MLIGVDAGTSVTKAAAFDRDGTLLGLASSPTVLRNPRPGWFEHDAEEVLGSVASAIRTLVAKVGRQPSAIGLTGQGDGLWLLDEHGRGTRPAISWMDARASDVLQGWMTDGRVQSAFRRTGNMMFAGCAGPLLAWLDEHEPRVLDRSATAGYCKDMVFQRFTGIRATDASDASLPFLEQQATAGNTRGYAEDVLALCDLGHRAELLAPVVEPHPVGELTDRAAELLGVAAGTPVSSGPFDLVASAHGSGVLRPGDGHLIVGTTLACQVVVDRVRTGGEPAGLTLASGVPWRWLRAMPAMVGTAALDWVLNLVGASHENLDELLADSPPNARGVRCLPYFSPAGERAPFVEPLARAGFDGLDLHNKPADLVRAGCEGIAFAARHCFEAAGLTGNIAACGGGVRSEAWIRLFADVLGVPIRISPIPEIGAYGAASTAAHAFGFDTAAWSTASRVLEPTEPERYTEAYQEYLTAVAAARERWSGR